MGAAASVSRRDSKVADIIAFQSVPKFKNSDTIAANRNLELCGSARQTTVPRQGSVNLFAISSTCMAVILAF
jgi:hypothetical protein